MECITTCSIFLCFSKSTLDYLNLHLLPLQFPLPLPLPSLRPRPGLRLPLLPLLPLTIIGPGGNGHGVN